MTGTKFGFIHTYIHTYNFLKPIILTQEPQKHRNFWFANFHRYKAISLRMQKFYTKKESAHRQVKVFSWALECPFLVPKTEAQYLHFGPMDPSAFSKRKLCNGENFRIKDFDEFRCFWGSWVKIIGFKKMYVCMYVWRQILSPS